MTDDRDPVLHVYNRELESWEAVPPDLTVDELVGMALPELEDNSDFLRFKYVLMSQKELEGILP